MSAPSDTDLERYPHVFFTSDSPWDPSVMDQEFSVHDFEIPALAVTRREATDNRVDEFGELRHVHHAFSDGRLPSLSEDLPNLVPGNDYHFRAVDSLLYTISVSAITAFTVAAAFLSSAGGCIISAFPQTVQPRLPDLDFLKPNFLWVPSDRLKATLDATTQYYRATVHHPFRKHFRSRFPAANVRRIPEWFSTDTIFSDTPAHDDGIPGHGGCMMLQLFGGVDSKFLAGYPLK
eukprot:14332182-Ditylum_brightwellii.AAC.1